MDDIKREKLIQQAFDEFGTYDPPCPISNESIADFALAAIAKREKEIAEALNRVEYALPELQDINDDGETSYHQGYGDAIDDIWKELKLERSEKLTFKE